MKRGFGILLNVSSLPSEYGIGSLGKEAYQMVDALKQSGAVYWQILPLSPTSYGDSPYASCAADAGNPYYIDLEDLAAQGLITGEELESEKGGQGRVNYEKLFHTRFEVLHKAYERFNKKSKAFTDYVKNCCAAVREYALYMVFKEKFGYKVWSEWQDAYKYRDYFAIKDYIQEHREEYEFFIFLQYQFFKQWDKLHAYAKKSGISIIGDVPICVAYDSADVWLHPNRYMLDEDLHPTVVAGVPPDCFTEDGQLWGNPIYNAKTLKKDGYLWWKERIVDALKIYDYLRIDHFRGFDRLYCIPYGSVNAKKGKWTKVLSKEIFTDLKRENVIAEDLGLIDEGVKRLIKYTGYPGMKIGLFAFDGDPQNIHKPSNYPENCLAYTGTHDNEPLTAYIQTKATDQIYRQDIIAEFEKLGLKAPDLGDNQAIAEAVKTLLLQSRAAVVIFPFQDVYNEGAETRMNLPGTVSTDNWSYRAESEKFLSLGEKIKPYVKLRLPQNKG